MRRARRPRRRRPRAWRDAPTPTPRHTRRRRRSSRRRSPCVRGRPRRAVPRRPPRSRRMPRSMRAERTRRGRTCHRRTHSTSLAPRVAAQQGRTQVCQARNVRSARVLSAPQRQGRGSRHALPGVSNRCSAIRNHAETSAHLANGRLVLRQPKLTNPACAGEARSNCVPLIFRSRRTRRPRRRARPPRHQRAVRGTSRNHPRRARRPRRLRPGARPARARPSPSASRSSLASATPRRSSRRALVLAPTRELAAQIAAELAPLAGVRGRTRRPPSTAASATARSAGRCAAASTSLVACPGRLDDLIEQRAVDLDDGRDRRRRRGRPHGRHGLPARGAPAARRRRSADRQTLLFSATLDGAVDVLVARLPDATRSATRSRGRTADVHAAEHRFWARRPRRPRRAHRRRHRAPTARRSCSAAPVTVPTGSPSSSSRPASRAARDPRRPLPGPARSRARRVHRRARCRRSSPPTSPPAASTSTTSRASCTSTCRPTSKDYLHRSGRTAARRCDRPRRVARGQPSGAATRGGCSVRPASTVNWCTRRRMRSTCPGPC